MPISAALDLSKNLTPKRVAKLGAAFGEAPYLRIVVIEPDPDFADCWSIEDIFQAPNIAGVFGAIDMFNSFRAKWAKEGRVVKVETANA